MVKYPRDQALLGKIISLLVLLLVKPIVLICTQSLIVGLWRAVGQDTDLQRALFVRLGVIQAGGKEAEG